jgi:hypothetical protein
VAKNRTIVGCYLDLRGEKWSGTLKGVPHFLESDFWRSRSNAFGTQRLSSSCEMCYGLRVLDGDLMVYQDARRSDKHTGCLSQKCPLDPLPLWRSFWFVRYLATATQRPAIYVWVGKWRYERAQRRQQAREQNKQMQPRQA